MVAELRIERLAQVGQPENGGIARVELQVLESDLIPGINRGAVGAHPIVRMLHIMPGYARVLAHKDRPAAGGYRAEFPRLQQDGIHRNPQAGGIQRPGFVEIDGTVAALEHVALVNGDVTVESDGLALEIDVRPVGENLQAVVALHLHRAAEADAFLKVALDLAAQVGDLQVFRQRRPEGHAAEGDVRRGHRLDQVHGRRHRSLGKKLPSPLLLRVQGKHKQRRDPKRCEKTGVGHRRKVNGSGRGK